MREWTHCVCVITQSSWGLNKAPDCVSHSSVFALLPMMTPRDPYTSWSLSMSVHYHHLHQCHLSYSRIRFLQRTYISAAAIVFTDRNNNNTSNDIYIYDIPPLLLRNDFIIIYFKSSSDNLSNYHYYTMRYLNAGNIISVAYLFSLLCFYFLIFSHTHAYNTPMCSPVTAISTTTN